VGSAFPIMFYTYGHIKRPPSGGAFLTIQPAVLENAFVISDIP